MATKKTTTKRSSQRGTKSSQTADSSFGTTSRSGSAGSNTNDDESDRTRRIRSTQSGSKTNEIDATERPASRTTNSSRSNSTKGTTGSRERSENRTSRSGSMSNEGGRSRSRSDEYDNRGASYGRGNSRATNRGAFQEGNYDRQWSDREYDRGWREDYPQNLRGMRDYDDRYSSGWRDRTEREYGYQGRPGYGADWYPGRDQNRYHDDRYERRGSDYGRQSERNLNRSGDEGGWSANNRMDRGRSGGYTGDQEYYTENEWNRQRGQGWNQYDNRMEQTDGYRGTTYLSRPSGKDDEGLRKLLTDQLKDMYWAEKELTKAIPKLINKSTSPELKNALKEHLQTTESHVQRVKEIFGLLGEKPNAKKCVAMEGLIKEADEITTSLDEGSVRDAGIICAAQKVEHYEIATYGCLSTYAEILNEMEACDLLEEILQEEKNADKTLTQVAYEINWEASEEEEESEDESEEEDDDSDKRERFSETDAIED